MMTVSDAGASGMAPKSALNVPPNDAARRDDAIYQGGRCVAEALEVRIDTQAREIHFGELSGTDNLLIPDDCEFREYRILIQKIGFASRQETGAAHKGRVLKGVVAEILGYRSQ